ncbi:MAG: hypothetical protein ACRDE2_16515 [Chitinophagaceae bacterium]
MKRLKDFLVCVIGLLSIAVLATSFTNVRIPSEVKVPKMLAYYQGSFVEVIGPTFGYVKVWSEDTFGGPVVTAIFYNAAERKNYGVQLISGYCNGSYVQNFDGYVTISGTQYEIIYSGPLSK